MTRMSLAANRPINWNVLVRRQGQRGITEHNLAASDYAAEHGRPGDRADRCPILRLRLASASTAASCSTRIPGWEKPMALPHDEKKAMLVGPDGRAALREAARNRTTGLQGISNWEHLRHQRDVRAREQAVSEGAAVGEIAEPSGDRTRSTRCATSSSPTTS